ncbi:hypothetical protein UA08_01566 [Talaromyces atroroseus]|uniref:Zinc finger PHD-type domain-containing protein n=1 Tax=Talaromyces atroroseus TaxID=1441469 RepID=A0A1Q5QAY1_TALAT|nr:hypothetical protein UA08_01566 [Talaromyces atroroseus]OKL62968.1 hypothetical protein UA08_01566 [Talaromyces atroroseus]
MGLQEDMNSRSRVSSPPPPGLSTSTVDASSSHALQSVQHAFSPDHLNPSTLSYFYGADHLQTGLAPGRAHPMAVLRNRVAGFPALAPALACASPVTETAIAASQPSAVQLQQKTTAQSLINLAPNLSNKPNDNQAALDVRAQQPLPLAPLAAKQQTPVDSPLQKPAIANRKRRNRRKRAHDSDDEIKANDSSSDDVSDDMLPVARQTKSGRQVNRPTFFALSPEPKQSPRQRPSPSGSTTTPAPSGAPVKRRRKVYRKNGKDINITCSRCQRGHSPATNSIVFCDECNGAWHQFCHDPPIDKQLIDVKEAEWFCNECRPGQRVTLLKLRLPPKKKSVSTESALGSLVCGSRFTTEEQRGYLSSLSHASLVDMLVTLSKKNPTLPIFPENMRDLRQSKFVLTPSSSSTTSILHQTLQSASSGISNTGVQMTEAQSKGTEEDSDDSGSEYEVEEHRLYPRPGNGFCLPPDEEDLDMLLDDPACSTFSYALHGYPQGNALADNALTIKLAG